MENTLNKVLEFHENFKVPVFNSPTEVDKQRRILGLKLLFEELTELADALGVKDSFCDIISQHLINNPEVKADTDVVIKEEVLDAVCDIQYILDGRIIEFGLKDMFLPAFNEVHASNMSKLCSSTSEAAKTVENYNSKGIKTYFESNGLGKFIVKRSSDDKVLKNINYVPFDSKKFFK